MSGRKPGDSNFSLREKKHRAHIQALKARIAAEKAKVKLKDAQLRETRTKLSAALEKEKAKRKK
jgi:hypothetical protein